MKKLNLAGVTGFWLCLFAILLGVASNGGVDKIMNYVNIPSLIVTLGGALFAVLATADSFGDYRGGVVCSGR